MYNSKVDDYISKAADFAQPILKHFRATVHKAAPGITESIKWGVPSFEYKNKIMSSLAAFKSHCAINFWSGLQITSLKPYLAPPAEGASNLGRIGNIKSLKDLPQNLAAIIKEAMALIDKGITVKRAPAKKSAAFPIPGALAKALAKNKKAKTAFEKLAPSHRKEYIQWINEAKTEATRYKRIATTIEWATEGKGKNWKYEKR
ncbi:MAG TPA: YdeI/OmpD-associated family protein [Niabella sp.]|nr:YdeI/OmpD-associated family protein [Niabella sp.]